MQASSVHRILEQGAEDILESRTSLIRTSRKAVKEEVMKVKVIFKNNYLFTIELHMYPYIAPIKYSHYRN